MGVSEWLFRGREKDFVEGYEGKEGKVYKVGGREWKGVKKKVE